MWFDLQKQCFNSLKWSVLTNIGVKQQHQTDFTRQNWDLNQQKWNFTCEKL
jgi:hypothetical protein